MCFMYGLKVTQHKNMGQNSMVCMNGINANFKVITILIAVV